MIEQKLVKGLLQPPVLFSTLSLSLLQVFEYGLDIRLVKSKHAIIYDERCVWIIKPSACIHNDVAKRFAQIQFKCEDKGASVEICEIWHVVAKTQRSAM